MRIRLVIKAKLIVSLAFLFSVASQADSVGESVLPCMPNPKPVPLGAGASAIPFTDFREEGTAFVQFTVTTSGKVIKPTVLESTNPKINDFALKSAVRLRFEPRQKPCLFKMSMRFAEP